MAAITFYTAGKEQTGNTVATICFATYLGITHNKKNLLIATGMNEETISSSFWPPRKEKKSGLFGPNLNSVSQNGIEELNRIIKSGKLTPELIQNYTKIALKGRLEILTGYKGEEGLYKTMQKDYPQVVNLAKKAYENVIIDLDRDLDIEVQKQILDSSDVVVALTTQKMDNVKKMAEDIEKGDFPKSKAAIITLGRYDSQSRYNAKNLTRSFLKKSDLVNTIPYNTLVFEATQEGKIIDLFLQFKKLKIQDENTFFMDEMERLRVAIEKKDREMKIGIGF